MAPEGRIVGWLKRRGAMWPDERWKVARRCARSAFASVRTKHTSRSGHFRKLWCRKSARRCGAKRISKSKCTKHLSVGALLEVEMSKKWMRLWREAHFQVKTCKSPQCRITFGSWDVEKVHAVVSRSKFPSQDVQRTTCRGSAKRHFAWQAQYKSHIHQRC